MFTKPSYGRAGLVGAFRGKSVYPGRRAVSAEGWMRLMLQYTGHLSCICSRSVLHGRPDRLHVASVSPP